LGAASDGAEAVEGSGATFAVEAEAAAFSVVAKGVAVGFAVDAEVA
jgi:hypothetical protein